MTNRILVVLASIFLGVVGCGGGGDDEGVREYVAAVTTVDGAARARFVSGAAPSGQGPIVTVTTNASVIPGGTTRVRLAADRTFTTAIVAIDGVDGYYELTLPAALVQAEVLITLSQQLHAESFAWAIGVGGPIVTTPVSVVEVGTGDVQVSLSWNTDADVDLHVIDPAGEEIYWESRESASGGELDLDSNAACSSDGPRNENITWAANHAPSGAYRVLVDYWSNCSAASTAYTVTVNVKGQGPMTFTGTFTGEGDLGGPGAGVSITTFDSRASARSLHEVHELGTFDVQPGASISMK
jgi:hypothetical protein